MMATYSYQLIKLLYYLLFVSFQTQRNVDLSAKNKIRKK